MDNALTQNPYIYSGDNPMMYSDPSGEWFGEFLSGQQNWSDFQLELGDATQMMTENSAVWDFLVSNPCIGGAIVGVGGGATAYIIVAGITYVLGSATTVASIPGMANTAEHIFGSNLAKHNLGRLLASFGGDTIAATRAIAQALAALQAAGNLPPTFYQGVNVVVNGIPVTVRGQIIDGVARISTAFIP